jgi:BASS family bile acid:Na+ symporter
LETDFISRFLLPTALALLMFGMGLSLSIEDFKKVFIYPKGLIAGLVSQIIILPSLAFLIADLANLPPELKVGIMIIAACPGGATSNLITYLLRGNVALSISMTTLNSFLTLVTTPLLIFFALLLFLGEGEQVQLPIIPTIFKIFYITLLPTSLGILIRYHRKGFAQRLEKPLRYILPILYGIIYLVAIFGSREEGPSGLISSYVSVAPWVIGLNLFGMSFGFFIGKVLRQSVRNQITLAIEVGIQNSALAITIASSAIFLDNFYMSIPAIVYGFFTFASAVVFGLIIKKIYMKRFNSEPSD